jgi:hypothetical protein
MGGIIGTCVGLGVIAGVLAFGVWAATRSLWAAGASFAAVIALALYNRGLARLASEHLESLATLAEPQAGLERALYQSRRLQWHLKWLALVVLVATIAGGAILYMHEAAISRRFR